MPILARNGSRYELMLPFDKIQGFLDLIQPGDVPPDKLQTLYHWQEQFVKEATTQFQAAGWLPPSSQAEDKAE